MWVITVIFYIERKHWSQFSIFFINLTSFLFENKWQRIYSAYHSIMDLSIHSPWLVAIQKNKIIKSTVYRLNIQTLYLIGHHLYSNARTLNFFQNMRTNNNVTLQLVCRNNQLNLSVQTFDFPNNEIQILDDFVGVRNYSAHNYWSRH